MRLLSCSITAGLNTQPATFICVSAHFCSALTRKDATSTPVPGFILFHLNLEVHQCKLFFFLFVFFTNKVRKFKPIHLKRFLKLKRDATQLLLISFPPFLRSELEVFPY
ncbi:hypothetical protein AMECASPLE_000072 [Ameca splendens]|uniref:Uncharacterized protein n=1 Tax=Ameca splendens TaxID=208324 RepID=A0ABV0Z6E9_9TELE